ncbi:hypothetical protein EU805_02415 [Salipiger sp. IMCC34102]|uniref:COG4223 family protein n=1 Tax=Salipiger sp. IMCC34102 TaxID=2510647 RepID=UPI00101CA793|nr:mitofilin family membrane protein [Salipiger sp. IMCC34102]RYH04248.1 hypothetical protein EU805_02415 [Salipiger sp. IMCC34102]
MADKVGKDEEPVAGKASTAMPPPTIPDRATSQGKSPEREAQVPPTAAGPVAASIPGAVPGASTSGTSSPSTGSKPATTAASTGAPASGDGLASTARGPVFLPMALGGLVAGLMGYGIAWTQFGTDDGLADPSVAEVDGAADMQAQLDQLRADLEALPEPQAFEAPEPFDASEIEDQLGALQSETADLRELVDTLTAQPIVGEDAQDAAVQSLSQQIAQQTAALQDQRNELQSQLDEIRTQADEIRAEAEEVRSTAVENARTETIQAALARVQGALETGAPMTAVLNDLSDALGEPAPDPLRAVAEEGAPTLSGLRDDFPDASRAALQTARASGSEGEGGFGSFLQRQFNVRSTAPREGDSVDAILSRAEDALRNGRLTDALAEVETLPEDTRAAMSDWIGRAQARADAVAAARQLDTNLTAN